MQEVADDNGDHVTAVKIMEQFQQYYYSHKNSRHQDDGKFLNIPAVRRAWEVHSQLSKCLSRYGSLQNNHNNNNNQQRNNTTLNDNDEEEEASIAVRKCVTAGFFGNAAKLANDGNYYTLRGKQMVQISKNILFLLICTICFPLNV